MGEVVADFFILKVTTALSALEELFYFSVFVQKSDDYTLFFDLRDAIKNDHKMRILVSFFRDVVLNLKKTKVCRVSRLKNATVSDWLTPEHFLVRFYKIAKLRLLYLGSFSLG